MRELLVERVRIEDEDEDEEGGTILAEGVI